MIRTQCHKKIVTKNEHGDTNGYLVPLYNVHDGFFKQGDEPQQVYLTVVSPHCTKGPHLHFIRTGFFTCIRGNICVITKENNQYSEYFSGEKYGYVSIEIPKGVPALIKNLGDDDAFILNMPCPAWTPSMNDEHSADFSDYIPGAHLSNAECDRGQQ